MMIQTLLIRRLSQLLLVAILGPVAIIASAETVYVSDELTVPLRSGASLQHRILSFLTSGTPMEVLETSEDGAFQRVNIDGKEGWIKAEYLMKTQSARSQLPVLNKRIESLKADIKEGKSTISDLNERIKQLETDNRALEKDRDGVTDSLDKLKQVAARPVAIAQENRELVEKLDGVTGELTLLQQENERLRDRNIKEWFMIGGGVSLISLFFGLIIPNIKWRRKRDSWGGGF